MTIADAITAVSVAIAAFAFVWGVNAWRREFVGKRRIELAESVLAQFYEAEEAIRDIRNPFSYVGEGKTRQRAENESPEDAALLDRAYIVIERYKKHEKLFADMRAMRYRVMASFGADAAESFNEVWGAISEIFGAAEMLGMHYWHSQSQFSTKEDDLQEFRKQRHKFEAIFWLMGEKDDEITPRVRHAVEKFETIARRVSG